MGYFFGYLGIVYFYFSIKENITLKKSWKNYSPVELIFFLPNLHFWTSSLGKGSVIIFGLGLFTYGLSRFNKRAMLILIGLFILNLPNRILILIKMENMQFGTGLIE